MAVNVKINAPLPLPKKKAGSFVVLMSSTQSWRSSEKF